MTDGKLLVEELLCYAETFLHLKKRDEIYFRNILLREFKIDEPMEEKPDLSYVKEYDVPDALVSKIEEYALENGIIEDGEQNLYSTYIFGMLSPLPSKVNEDFNAIKEKEGIESACKYFYDLSVKSNYVQKTAIGRNLKWEYKDGANVLEITINLSKPEKNNKDVAKLLIAPKKNKYPACLLCKENEGYEGTATHPARENIRTISLTLGGEPWFVQYSPYAYYNEHLIAISENHVPMHIKADTIDKLMDFVDAFPNYMMGSNAALPIIGGSILNHEHFQGGGHLMPMHRAPLLKKYADLKSKYKSVKVGIVDWYNSVIRLESKDRKEIGDLAKDVISAWADFTCPECNIFAETDGVKHNSLSPVCRLSNGEYVIDMILRNNIVTEERPEGYFHARPEFHNIKKESIGLIEAMGLFILPGRLKRQLSEIAEILCGQKEYDEKALSEEGNDLYVHRNMIKELLKNGRAESKEQADEIVKNKVNDVCKNILFDTAVFKKDENGFNGFIKFLKVAGITEK